MKLRLTLTGKSPKQNGNKTLNIKIPRGARLAERTKSVPHGGGKVSLALRGKKGKRLKTSAREARQVSHARVLWS